MEEPKPGLWNRLAGALQPGSAPDPGGAAAVRPLDEARRPRPRSAAAASDCASAGEVVAGRYHLDELLVRRGTSLTWLATDALLGRTVLVHLLDHHEPAILSILDEARRAAPATDGRFLRVLDADLAEGHAYGAYIVCEYAPGQSLEQALEQGPFAPRQACRIVREVADALAALHRQGLHHRHIDPDTVILTTSGSVKIVGLKLETALAGRLEPDPDGADRDVESLADLLYATLTGRWPHGEAFGLPAGPLDRRGRLRSPASVQRGVPADVDRLSVRLLDASAPPLSARDVADELDGLLHVQAGEFDRSLYQPVARARTPRQPGGLVRTSAPASAPTPGETTEQLEATSLFDPFEDEDDDPDGEPTPFTPIPPPAPHDPHGVTLDAAPPTRHGWVKGLAALFAVALLASLAGVLVPRLLAPAPPATRPPLAVASVRDFDPRADGGDGAENSAQARLAADGNAATAWTTERYGRSAAFNGRKPGVGLVVDLGSVQQVASVTVTLAGATDVELRVPLTEAADPPLASAKQWRAVTTASGSGEVTLSAPGGVRTRYLLVYLTKLPSAGTGFQGGVSEVVVRS